MKLSAIKRNSLLQMTVIVTSYIMSFLLSALLGRMLGPAELGAWSATAATSSIILGFTLLGIDSPLARRMAIEPARTSEWLGHGVGIRLFISLPLSWVLILLVSMLNYQGIVAPIFAATYALYAGFGNIAGLLSRACQILQHFSWQYIPLLMGTLPGLLAAFIWVKNGGGLLEVVICTTAGQLVGLVGLSLAMHKVANLRPRYAWQAWKSLLTESWPLAVSTPFLAAYSRVDSVLLLNLKGTESVGYYSAAYGFFMAFCGLASGVQTAMFPAIAGSYEESPSSAYRLFKQGLRWMLMLAICGIVGTIFFGRWALVLVYGESFGVSAPTLEVLMIASIFLLLNNTYGMTLNAIGQQRLVLYLTIGGLFTNVLANILLIPNFDFIGAALATLITEGVVLMIAHLCLNPHWFSGNTNKPI
jgi:O-antigen/teichoic acid export membrane protein